MSKVKVPALTSLEIRALVREFRHVLTGAKISNVYKLADDIFSIKLRIPAKGERELVVWVGKTVFLTSFSLPHPKQPPTICMLLRKYIRGATVVDVEQYDMDRIIDLRLVKSDKEYLLVIEIIREGNIVLVNCEDNKIIAAYRYKKMKDRDIVPGSLYKRPPLRGVDPLSKDAEEAILKSTSSEKGVLRALVKCLNVPPELVQEACMRCGVDPKVKTYNLRERIYGILNEIRRIIQEVDEQPKPHILTTKDGEARLRVLDFTIDREFRGKEYLPTTNEAIEKIYLSKVLNEIKASTTAKTREKIEEITRRIEAQKRAIEKVENRIRVLSKIAQTFSTRIYTIQSILDELNKVIMNGEFEKAGALLESTLEKVLGMRIRARVALDKKVVYMALNGVEIELNPRLSAGANISRIYNEVKNLRRSAKEIKHAMREARRELERLKKKVMEMEEEVEERVVSREKAWYEKFRWFITSNGFLVIAGRDSKQNETIVRKYMRRHDIVLHADIYGSPITVIRTESKKFSDKDIREAAEFTAVFSRAWREGLASVDVFWVRAEQVTKSPPSGEYLKRGAFMIYGKRNYLRNVKLEVVLVAEKSDSGILLRVLPSTRATVYSDKVVLVPGHIPKSKLVHEVFEHLRKFCRGRGVRLLTTIDQLYRDLPTGGFHILECRGIFEGLRVYE